MNKLHSDVPKSEYDSLRGVSKGSLTTRGRLDHQNLHRVLYFQKWEAVLPFAVMPHGALICPSHRYHNKDIQFYKQLFATDALSGK